MYMLQTFLVYDKLLKNLLKLGKLLQLAESNVSCDKNNLSLGDGVRIRTEKSQLCVVQVPQTFQECRRLHSFQFGV